MEASSESESECHAQIPQSRTDQVSGSGSSAESVSALAEEVDVTASASNGATSQKAKKKRYYGHKSYHRSQKTNTYLAPKEQERFVRIIISPDVHVPLKLRTSIDLADDLGRNGIESWVYKEVIKSGQYKNKSKQKKRYLFNFRENEKLCTAVNTALSQRPETEEEENEVDPDAAENDNFEAQEGEHVLFHVIDLEQYFETEAVFVLIGPDQKDKIDPIQHHYALRERRGPSSLKTADQKGPSLQHLQDEGTRRKHLKDPKERDVEAHAGPVRSRLRNAPSTSAEGSNSASISATRNNCSSSAQTSSHGTVLLGMELKKGGGSKNAHDQPTAVPQQPGSALKQPTCGAEISAAVRNHPQQHRRMSDFAPGPGTENLLPVTMVAIKKSEIKKTAKGHWLDDKNQPLVCFPESISYVDIDKVVVVIKNSRSLNSALEYLRIIASTKSGRDLLKRISICAHPLLQSFILELIGGKKVKVLLTCHMESLRASMAKYLILHLNIPHTILSNTETEFHGTSINLAPVVILNIFTAASVTTQYIYGEARLNSHGQPEECTHGQVLDTMGTAIPYNLFKMALETGQVPNIPIKYPCSCGASAIMKFILSVDGFLIRFYSRGLALSRDNIHDVLPLRATIEKMKYRLDAITGVTLHFKVGAHSVLLIPSNGDFDIIRDGYRECAGEFSVLALMANYIRDEE